MRKILPAFLLLLPLAMACGPAASRAVPAHDDARSTLAPTQKDAPKSNDAVHRFLDDKGALLEREAAGAAELRALGQNPRRIVSVMAFRWTKVVSPLSEHVDVLVYAFPDGRLRWAAAGVRARAATTVVTDIVYKDAVPRELWETLQRPMDELPAKARALPLLATTDAGELPQEIAGDLAKMDAGFCSATELAAEMKQAIAKPSIRWVGTVVEGQGRYAFVSSGSEAAKGTEHPAVKVTAMRPPAGAAAAHDPKVPCPDGVSCYELAQCTYRAGDHAKAAGIYAISCGRGHGMGCLQIARTLEKGDGVPRDPAAAVARYRAAHDQFEKECSRKDAEGCYGLGIAYESGQGVPVHYGNAVKAYREGCDLGMPDACFNLGGMYYKGKGVKKSIAKAREMYRKACDAGDEGGCRNAERL